jgi:hypothetical protein
MKSKIIIPPPDFPGLYQLTTVDADVIVLCTSYETGIVLIAEDYPSLTIGMVINPMDKGTFIAGDWSKIPTGSQVILTQE